MPLWLWQEVQALPWSTEIVALTCGTQNCLRPPSSLLKHPRQACCATPAQDQKCWNAAAFEQSQFFDHTGQMPTGGMGRDSKPRARRLKSKPLLGVESSRGCATCMMDWHAQRHWSTVTH